MNEESTIVELKLLGVLPLNYNGKDFVKGR